MPYFDHITMQINIASYSKTELENDIEAQSKFIHEYLHYMQHHLGLMGRTVIPNFWKVFTSAGLMVNNNGNTVERGTTPQHIKLLESLSRATPDMFSVTDLVDLYSEILKEVELCLDARITPICDSGTYPIFVSVDEIIDGNTCSFVHLNVADNLDNAYNVRLIDGVIFENLSRAIQLLYLSRNQLQTHYLQDIEGKPCEIKYRCIYYLLNNLLIGDYESKLRWTITICTVALLCCNPGQAIVEMYGILYRDNTITIQDFLNRLKVNLWFTDELSWSSVEKFYGEVIKISQYWEIEDREIMQKYLNNVHSMLCSLKGNLSFFADSVVEINMLQTWIERFGCPDVVVKDNEILNSLWGIALDDSWLNYYFHGHRLLNRNIN